MGFMKNLFRPQIKETTSTPSSSAQTTPATSPGSSLVNAEGTIKPFSKYQQDPVRTSKQPDTVGSFFDPMSGHGYYATSNDITNTGA